MNQRQFNKDVLRLLRGVVNELRRGMPSHTWGQDMMSLPDQLDRLERIMGMATDEVES